MLHFLLLALKFPYTGPKAVLAKALAGVKAVWTRVVYKPDLDRVLAPFAKVHAKLDAVVADAAVAEAALRAKISDLLAQAEAKAADGAQAAAAKAKLGDLLGK